MPMASRGCSTAVQVRTHGFHSPRNGFTGAAVVRLHDNGIVRHREEDILEPPVIGEDKVTRS